MINIFLRGAAADAAAGVMVVALWYLEGIALFETSYPLFPVSNAFIPVLLVSLFYARDYRDSFAAVFQGMRMKRILSWYRQNLKKIALTY